MKRFWRNLQRTPFWRDRSFQCCVLFGAIGIAIIVKFFPVLTGPLLIILVGIICIGLPVTVLAIYDGLLNEDEDDP